MLSRRHLVGQRIGFMDVRLRIQNSIGIPLFNTSYRVLIFIRGGREISVLASGRPACSLNICTKLTNL